MPTIEVPENIVQTTGPLITGYLLNWGLFGTVTVQVYYYYIAFPEDRCIFKVTVYTVYLFEFVQSIVLARDAFNSFGIGYGSFDAVNKLSLTGLLVPILGGTVGFIVQLFYANHIHNMTRTTVVSVIIVIMALVGWASGLATGILSFRLGSITELRTPAVFIIAGIWWGASVAVDSLIGVSMCYILTKKDPAFHEAQTKVTRGVRLIIETGMITAVVAIITLIFFFTWMYTDYFGCPAFVFAKLYACSLLMLFNSRMRIVGSWDEVAAETAGVTQIESHSSDTPSHLESIVTRPRSDSLGGSQTRGLSGVVALGPGQRRPSEYLRSQRPRSGSGFGSGLDSDDMRLPTRHEHTSQRQDKPPWHSSPSTSTGSSPGQESNLWIPIQRPVREIAREVSEVEEHLDETEAPAVKNDDNSERTPAEQSATG